MNLSAVLHSISQFSFYLAKKFHLSCRFIHRYPIFIRISDLLHNSRIFTWSGENFREFRQRNLQKWFMVRKGSVIYFKMWHLMPFFLHQDRIWIIKLVITINYSQSFLELSRPFPCESFRTRQLRQPKYKKLCSALSSSFFLVYRNKQ